jgi:predicted transcriptional regulator
LNSLVNFRNEKANVDALIKVLQLLYPSCITQKQLEELIGVRQPVIARMEKGNNPQLDTVLKVLAPLGKTLSVVPLIQE